jgi:hypothetical protein
VRAGKKCERGLKLDLPRVNGYLKLLGQAGDLSEITPEDGEGDTVSRTAPSAVDDQRRGEQADDT